MNRCLHFWAVFFSTSLRVSVGTLVATFSTFFHLYVAEMTAGRSELRTLCSRCRLYSCTAFIRFRFVPLTTRVDLPYSCVFFLP